MRRKRTWRKDTRAGQPPLAGREKWKYLQAGNAMGPDWTDSTPISWREVLTKMASPHPVSHVARTGIASASTGISAGQARYTHAIGISPLLVGQAMHNPVDGVEFARHYVKIAGIACVVAPKDCIGHVIGELDDPGSARVDEQWSVRQIPDDAPLSAERTKFSSHPL